MPFFSFGNGDGGDDDSDDGYLNIRACTQFTHVSAHL